MLEIYLLLINLNKPILQQSVFSHIKKSFFLGQISKKLWNDKDGSLCKITSRTCGI